MSVFLLIFLLVIAIALKCVECALAKKDKKKETSSSSSTSTISSSATSSSVLSSLVENTPVASPGNPPPVIAVKSSSSSISSATPSRKEHNQKSASILPVLETPPVRVDTSSVDKANPSALKKPYVATLSTSSNYTKVPATSASISSFSSSSSSSSSKITSNPPAPSSSSLKSTSPANFKPNPSLRSSAAVTESESAEAALSHLAVHTSSKTQIMVDIPNYSKWYDVVNLCVINSEGREEVRSIVNDCRNKTGESKVGASMCIVGNSGHSGFCSPRDSKYADRVVFRQGFKEYADHKYNPILSILDKLKENNERLLFVGDSTTRAVYDYINCELSREVSKTRVNAHIDGYIERYGVSKNVTNIMSEISKIFSVKIDKNKNLLSKNINIVMNFGLHYHIYDEYYTDVKHVLTYLNDLIGTYPHKLRVFWKESSAQHFGSVDGLYFSNAKTSAKNSSEFTKYNMNPSYGCAPLDKEYVDKNNWRNLAVADIIKTYKLTKIMAIPWYSFTQELWHLHPYGDNQDCTHFCNTPLLYLPIYSFIDKHIGKEIVVEPVAAATGGSGGHHGSHGGDAPAVEPDYSDVKPQDTYFMKGLFVILICIFPFVMNRWIRNDKLDQASR